MSNSKLVNYTKISPNSNPRNHTVKKITIHHMAGNLSVEGCGDVFASAARQASANYGIGSDGRIGMYVEEHNRAWTSANPENDHQAITIEVANDGGAPDWHVSDKAMDSLIDLCVDVCKRNGIAKLKYTGDASGNLTRHNMFIATTCPGPYLQSKFPYIAAEVNKKINGSDTTDSAQASSVSCKYGVGTPVCTCRIWSSSTDTGAGYKGDWSGKITRVILGARHPYLINDGTGWTDDTSIDSDPHVPGGGSAASFAPASIVVGSNVVVTNPIDYNGVHLGVTGTYTVMELNGSRVVIGRNGQVTCAIHINNIKLA